MKPADTSVLDGMQASINKLAAQVSAGIVKSPPGDGGRSLRCYDCGQPGHVRNDCPNKGTSASKSFPPADGAPLIRQVNGVSETWCATCKHWTTGRREHSTATHVWRPSPRGNTPCAPPAIAASPVVAPVTGVAAVATVASVDSPYTGGRLTLHHGLFVGQWSGQTEPWATSDVLFADPSLCADDMFHSDAFRLSLFPSDVEEKFHDAVRELIDDYELIDDVSSMEESSDDDDDDEVIEFAVAELVPQPMVVEFDVDELVKKLLEVEELVKKPIEPIEEDDAKPFWKPDAPILIRASGDNDTSSVTSLICMQTTLLLAYLLSIPTPTLAFISYSFCIL
jgi:hypothetical protein